MSLSQVDGGWLSRPKGRANKQWLAVIAARLGGVRAGLDFWAEFELALPDSQFTCVFVYISSFFFISSYGGGSSSITTSVIIVAVVAVDPLLPILSASALAGAKVIAIATAAYVNATDEAPKAERQNGQDQCESFQFVPATSR